MQSSAKAVDFRQQANGVTLHGVAAGPENGPLAILLHGFPEFWWGWRHQIGPLSEAGLRVLVPDQRGYNLSSKPVDIASYDLDTLAADVIALADAFGGGKVRLVGHDWGGLVAWWAASHYPDRVERLAILNAPHPAAAGSYLRANPSQAFKSSYIAFFQLPFVPEAVLRANDFAIMQLTLLGSSRPGIFTDEVLAHYRKAWAEPGALTAMLNWYRALRRRPDLHDSRIGVPTLVIWGEQDRFLERGLAEASLSLCDAGRPVWFETATHWVHLEEPEEVSAELVEFLAG